MKLLVLITLHSIKTQFNIYCYQFIEHIYIYKTKPSQKLAQNSFSPIVRFENSPPFWTVEAQAPYLQVWAQNKNTLH